MAGKIKAIVIHEKDTVAVALEALAAGSEVFVALGDARRQKIKLISPIPMGHKFALRNHEKGAPVIKYGEPIGTSTQAIARGEHVHIHNVAGKKEGGAR
jgi:altronate dehydratase small subunit